MYTPEFFAEEMEVISNPKLRDLVLDALRAAPAYFWTVPASLTGKYHPIDSQGEGGLCRHTKKVAWFVQDFGRAHLLERDRNFAALEAYKPQRCALVAAALLHDITKYGTEDTVGQYKAYAFHGVIAWEWLSKFVDAESSRRTQNLWRATRNLVKGHMGRWGRCPPEERSSISSMLLQMADVAATNKRFIAFKEEDYARKIA